MKYLVIIIVAVLAAVQAMPHPGFGLGAELGLGGGYGSGSTYGGSGFATGNNGYLNKGYGQNALNTHHNTGHHENDYSAHVQHHEASDHDIGGISKLLNGGHLNAGHRAFGQGHNNYGNGWGNGYLI